MAEEEKDKKEEKKRKVWIVEFKCGICKKWGHSTADHIDQGR